MSPFDLIVVVIVLGLALLGFRRGFVKEVIETIGAIVAAVVAYRYHSLVSQWFELSVDSSWWSRFAVFFGTFIAVMILITLAGHFLRKFMKSINLGMYDRLAGFVLGGVKGGIAVAAMSLALLWIGPIGDEVLAESKYARANLMVFHLLSEALPDSLREKYAGIVGNINEIAERYGGDVAVLPISVAGADQAIPEQITGYIVAIDSTDAHGIIEYTILGKDYRISMLQAATADNRRITKGSAVCFSLVYVPEDAAVYATNVRCIDKPEGKTEEE